MAQNKVQTAVMPNNQASVCQLCGETAGKKLNHNFPAQWHMGICHLCGEYTDVTDAFEFDLYGATQPEAPSSSWFARIIRWLQQRSS